MIIANGEKVENQEGKTIFEFLKSSNYPEMVVVELNGKIISKNNWNEKTLSQNDVIEVIYFVGGGSI